MEAHMQLPSSCSVCRPESSSFMQLEGLYELGRLLLLAERQGNQSQAELCCSKQKGAARRRSGLRCNKCWTAHHQLLL